MAKGCCKLTNKELSSYLEAIKIIVENATTKAEILLAIEKMQCKLKE